MSKLNDLLSRIISKVNNAATKDELSQLSEAIGDNQEQLSQLSAEIDAIGTQEEIVQQVIAALGTPVFGTVDANKVITLTGALADGTYTVKYEDAEGNETTIGTLTAKAGPKYTNRIPLSINADGTPYNGGKGYKTGFRLNSSGVEAVQDGIEVTGFIPAKDADTVYFANISWPKDASDASKYYIVIYDASFTKLAALNLENLKTQSKAGITYDANGNPVMLHMPTYAAYYQKQNVAYLRISAQEITDASVITVNEEIEV